MWFSSGTSRWWIAVYLAVTLVFTTGWLILSQPLAEQTGLRRQVWLANDFQGTPVINDVAREPTLDFLDDDPRLPRQFISARWRGYWYVPSRRSFTLHVEADDYADIWIDGEQRFARSSAAARAVRLDAGVHELQIVYQQYAGAANLAFTGGSGDAYPLPLRTGYLFPDQPEPNLLLLVGIVDRLKLTVGILWAAGALAAAGALTAAVFILWRRRTTHGTLDRRWTIRLSLVLTSTAVALVTSEICLRLTAPVGFYVWPPNHRAAFNPAPGVMSGVTGVSRFIISADGIRGRRLTTSDGHRILVVGGSTSECLYLDQREAWPAIVETSLQEALGRSDIWVGNVGKSGHSTRDHRLQVARLLDQLPRIDTVIMLVGINDLILRLRRDLDYRPLAEESPEYHRRLERHAFSVRRTSRLAPPGSARTALGLLLHNASIRAGLAEPSWADDVQDSVGSGYVRSRRLRQRALAIRAAPPDLATALIEYAENLRFIIADAERRDTDVVFMTQPSLYGPDLPPTLRELLLFGRVGVERHSAGNEYYSVDALATALGRYNETLLAVCATARIDCIDLDAKLPKDTTVFYDDVHFNEAGARQVAMTVVAHLLDTTTLVAPGARRSRGHDLDR